ncbi:MAG TPA: putative metalloprotease CJM1_0395 family protein [Spongiibacteraceae bacterium]|jgi:hypothetical protein|nr:putative metalloprotease CJM1_0395 family protein [Spongiibacteraceae bacterium]HUH39176.1 putative metalloprotease CJM1_0395 family protein [Spongiibacteraceae bacterium]
MYADAAGRASLTALAPFSPTPRPTSQQEGTGARPGPLPPVEAATEGAATRNPLTRDTPPDQADTQRPDTAETRQSPAELRREQLEIRSLAARDREVRAHEAAHAAVGGSLAGSPSYTYQRGPNGRSYAVAGEVPINLTQDPANPAATLRDAEQVRRAALAPAQPSAQDRRIAAVAMQVAQQAQVALARQVRDSESGAAPGSAPPDRDAGRVDGARDQKQSPGQVQSLEAAPTPGGQQGAQQLAEVQRLRDRAAVGGLINQQA